MSSDEKFIILQPTMTVSQDSIDLAHFSDGLSSLKVMPHTQSRSSGLRYLTSDGRWFNFDVISKSLLTTDIDIAYSSYSRNEISNTCLPVRELEIDEHERLHSST